MRAPASMLLLAAALGGCGPYSELGQKLDVGVIITGGDTWISASGPDVHVLMLGTPDPGGRPVPFAVTSISLPVSAGTAAWAAQGVWTGSATSPSITLREQTLYELKDERGTAILQRSGATRQSVDRTLTLQQSRADGKLVLTGDASVAGTYVLLGAALARLGSSSPADASCAFHLANLAVLSSETRIIGFGSARMLQYSRTATFKGTVSGNVAVHMSGSLSGATTDITYTQFSDFEGVQIDGVQTTDANGSGDGSMSGTLTLKIAAPAPALPVEGTISYGADAIQVKEGSPIGGNYVVTLTGGGSTKVSPVGTPTPSVSECLGLLPPQ